MPVESVEAAPDSSIPAPLVSEPLKVTPRSNGLLGKIMSALRGDKYMADAYPPHWQGAAAPPAAVKPGAVHPIAPATPIVPARPAMEVVR
jgi:hypothetical protein